MPVPAGPGPRAITPNWLYYVFGPAIGAGLVVAFVHANADASEIVYVLIAFLGGSMLAREALRRAEHLPLVGGLSFAVGPLLGAAFVEAIAAMTQLPVLPLGEIGIVVAASTLVPRLAAELLARLETGRPPIRIAVVGNPAVANELSRELGVVSLKTYVVVGTVGDSGEPADLDAPNGGLELAPAPGSDHLPVLGRIDQLPEIVRAHSVDLLLVTHDGPRLEALEEIARSCVNLPVRVCDLSDFCERAFGHVPISEINGSWFQYIMHPTFHVAEPASKRMLDLVLSLAAGVALAPLMGVLMLLVRLDGGPALFRQTRVGEGGQPFTLYKLRTMRVGVVATWTTPDDPRVTRVGRFLRRTHLDEVPQLYNVVRGEMSLVGPRPEQPSFVRALEEAIPFYSRRHLLKPGLTGWAQVRGGYAGSRIGSAQKLCYDLYYLKHRSIGLDVVILLETVRTLVRDQQYPDESRVPSLLLGDRYREPLGAVSLAEAAIGHVDQSSASRAGGP